MRLAKQLLWMVFGYGAAVVVATFVTVALLVAASALPDNGLLGSYYKIISDVFGLAFVGLIVTTSYAFPGWLISVSVAAWRNENRKGYFSVTGGLTALSAHFILSGFTGAGPMFGMTGEMGMVILWSLIGGLCGGWTYWRVAEVRFGQWAQYK